MSYDIEVWRIIKKKNLPIPPKKDDNGQVIVSSDPLDLEDYTEKQSVVIQVNAKVKNMLYNAISGEEYENISSCETAKEIWDMLEVIDEGTNKVKETRINLLVRDYDLFQMKDRESVEEMFSRNFQKKKSFGAWSDEEEFDHEEIANMCFMTINEESSECSGELGLMANKGTSEVRLPTCPICQELQEFIDIAFADIEKVLNELRKIQREKKDWALKLEVCEIDRDMLQDKVYELQLQLNGLRKSTSHSSVRSNQFALHKSPTRTRNPSSCTHCSKNGHNSNHYKFSIRGEKASEYSNNPSYFYCGILDHTSNHCRFKNNRRWEQCKKNRKWKWYLDSACSRHMTGDKQLFKTVIKLDGGIVTFGDKSKGNVIGVGRVPLGSTCDVDEVYLVDELGYNLLSINQLYDNDYEFRFKKHDWFIEDESGKVILCGN
uniref:Retrovirus-related Pol polyprotein from transposon TNT 1-94-like beta-barrel domain-containing protein n=1 Tax=Nicotiana tabacum TaxID=4097 RepID=A0A1S4DJH0_TOBAC|nr:PREDICTED: uncharacterized protein LOC107830463 [Nicotiana tabacum]